MAEKKLYRSCKNRILAGVCGGLAEYFEIDPVLVRLIVALLFFTGLSIVFYIIAWVIIPEESNCGEKDVKTKPIASVAKTEKVNETKAAPENSDGRLVTGIIVIVIGLIFLMQNIFGARVWDNLWPVLLVIIGLYFIFKARK